MGKSSTANSLYNEQVAQIRSFQQDTSQPDVIRRAAQGFELTVIDTPGLLESDTVSTTVSFCPSICCQNLLFQSLFAAFNVAIAVCFF